LSKKGLEKDPVDVTTKKKDGNLMMDEIIRCTQTA
jgi:hypothetical protein